jgi:ATP-dependent DNA ligase
MSAWREFRFESKGKSAPLVWKIKQDGETYQTQHGILDGAMQTNSDRPGDKGKPDTKAYVNPTDNCTFHVEREIRKKTEKGYIEYIDGKPSSVQVNEIVFDKLLPKNFCSYKPQTSIEDATLAKLHKSGKARYTRKYDGMAHVAVHHTHGWEIYTRRMDLATERFPNHLLELEASKFQVGTIIIGEMACQRPDGTDDFKGISRICRSEPEEARKLVTDGEVSEPLFIIFDVLFHNGQDLKNNSYDERSGLWKNFPAPTVKSQTLIRSVEYFKLTPESWMALAKEKGWEGFVVTDGSAVPDDKFYSFHGDAKRPKGHYKLKPVYEDDVVIFAAAAGSGKRLNGIGAVHVKQLHPSTKQWMYCGKVGSGFTDEDIADLERLCQKHQIPTVEKDKDAEKMDLNKTAGLVCQIEYGERQPGTQKFRFPVFIRVRDDKAVAECFAQKLAAEEVDDE